MNFRKSIYLLLSFLLAVSTLFAHDEKPHFLFSPNKGQWDKNVLYRLSIPGGTMFLEKSGVTFRYYDSKKLAYIHDHKGQPMLTGDENTIDGVTVRTQLLQANTSTQRVEQLYTQFYENWFIGNDPSQHATKVFPAMRVAYENIYPGIDWVWYEKDGFLKYDFKVKVGANPALIQTRYEGQNQLQLDALGNLLCTTPFSILKEEKPIAYQVNGKDTIWVACDFHLANNVLYYDFPNGYDERLDLVIDPSLIFSTYSGSTADNFGFTATYDSKGFLYAGGNVFALGYNTTPGAFQVTYGNGNIDCAITKYDTTGSFMVWSSYLGGTGSEMPHSMVVNKLNQLFVYGTTGSPNFPTTPNAYDQSYNGGTNLTSTGVGYTDANGSDIFVCKFSVDGTQLLASTFLGGSGNDGLNLGGTLNHNYADLSRGEIDIDNSNNIYLATSTGSQNFPVTGNAIQPSHGGGTYDGVVLKMDNSLTTLVWSTYLGGNANDAVYSLAVDKKNNIIVTGGTMSVNFPVTEATFNTHNGNADAFVTIINSAGTQINHSILYGTSVYDQAYFVELDNAQNVYLLGQTNASTGYFHTGTGFGVANGNQFISKFSPDLTTRVWSTAFGNQNGHPDISPTAFLVDVCKKIYISGWGGTVNNSNVPGSTVTGLPITPNAYQSTTNGSDFYIMVMEDDASGMSYATYFGGTLSPEHVDGGTSRFNRKGEIYQSVCAGCGSHDDFPTTPGAWSNTNNSFNCNNGVFKFHFDFPSMIADFDIPPSQCAPATITFPNFSSGATEYYWDLGNGQTSTDSVPTATYTTSGVYTIMLVANNTTGTTCNLTDTIVKQVVILGLDGQNLPNLATCGSQSIEIGVQPLEDPSVSFSWSPNTGLSDVSAPNPIFNPSVGTQNYQLIISNGVCSDTVQQTVTVSPIPSLVLNDTIVCAGIPMELGFSNPPSGMTFLWSPGTNLSSATSANPLYTPQASQTFKVVYGYPGCNDSLERTVDVLDLGLFTPVDTAMCPGDSVQVTEIPNIPGITYSWSPTQWVSNPTIPNPLLFAPLAQDFQLIVSNGLCADTLIKHVGLLVHPANAGSNDTICIGQSVVIGPDTPSSFLQYDWSPSVGLNQTDIPNPTASPQITTNYVLQVHAQNNPNACAASDTVEIVVKSPGAPGFGFDQFAGCYGYSVTVNANGNPNYSYGWFTNNGQTGSGSQASFEVPFDTTITFNMIVSGEGCTDTISVTKTFESFASQWGQLLVPNIFTPNNDNVNECFAPAGVPEECYWLYVYNRWGVLVFDSFKLDKKCWDGKYMKSDTRVVDGVYFWVLEIGGIEYHGTVTVAGGLGGH